MQLGCMAHSGVITFKRAVAGFRFWRANNRERKNATQPVRNPGEGGVLYHEPHARWRLNAENRKDTAVRQHQPVRPATTVELPCPLSCSLVSSQCSLVSAGTQTQRFRFHAGQATAHWPIGVSTTISPVDPSTAPKSTPALL